MNTLVVVCRIIGLVVNLIGSSSLIILGAIFRDGNIATVGLIWAIITYFAYAKKYK
jgi:hypothetical protein